MLLNAQQLALEILSNMCCPDGKCDLLNTTICKEQYSSYLFICPFSILFFLSFSFSFFFWGGVGWVGGIHCWHSQCRLNFQTMHSMGRIVSQIALQWTAANLGHPVELILYEFVPHFQSQAKTTLCTR